ncbi:MAG TPA: YafY family protein [Clostridia bacterium]|nr:YafY family protein [Clostridia bacterium]
MRLHRLISMLLTIENKGRITAKELSLQLETSVRTIYRDIDSLCEAGIPIVSEPGVNGGISLAKGYQVGIRQLQKEDIIYLYLNGMGVKADRKSDITLRSDSSLLKLRKLLSREDASSFNTIVDKFYVDDSPWWGTQYSLNNVDTLIKALWQSSKLSISYRKVDGTVSERIIRPYGIAVKNNDWYLVAYCEKSSSIRTFKCERISECRIMPELFITPETFSLKDYFIENVSKFRSERNEQEQYPVTIKLPQKNAYLMKNFEVYSSREEGGTIEATVNMYSLKCAMRDFWNLISGGAEVISPPELREAVKGRLSQLLNIYGQV